MNDQLDRIQHSTRQAVSFYLSIVSVADHIPNKDDRRSISNPVRLKRRTLTYMKLSIDSVEYSSGNERDKGEVYEVQPEEVGFILDPLAGLGALVTEPVENGHVAAIDKGLLCSAGKRR